MSSKVDPYFVAMQHGSAGCVSVDHSFSVRQHLAMILAWLWPWYHSTEWEHRLGLWCKIWRHNPLGGTLHFVFSPSLGCQGCRVRPLPWSQFWALHHSETPGAWAGVWRGGVYGLRVTVAGSTRLTAPSCPVGHTVAICELNVAPYLPAEILKLSHTSSPPKIVLVLSSGTVKVAVKWMLSRFLKLSWIMSMYVLSTAFWRKTLWCID